MSDKTKKEIRREYIKAQNELTDFIMEYTSSISGFDEGLAITDNNEDEYERLKARVDELKLEYKNAPN